MQSINSKIRVNLNTNARYVLIFFLIIAGLFNVNAQNDIQFKDTDILFADIENSPIYKGCKGDALEKKECTQNKLTRKVLRSFNTSIAKRSGLTGKQSFVIVFKVDKEGYIVDIESTASNAALNEEAVRVLHTIPQMTPGSLDGNKVDVICTIPVVIDIF